MKSSNTKIKSPETEIVERFKFEFERVGGIFIKTSREKVFNDISNIITVENVNRVFIEKFGNEIDKILKNLPVGQIITQPHSVEQLAQVDASITGCDFLIVETGTIVFIHRENRFKSSLLLPRIHIVIADVGKFCPTFEELFTKIGGRFDSILMVTGPSRTADIEKVIVLGVHGPQKVYLLLLLKQRFHSL